MATYDTAKARFRLFLTKRPRVKIFFCIIGCAFCRILEQCRQGLLTRGLRFSIFGPKRESGGIGRRTRLRIWHFGVRVRLPPLARF